MLLSRPIFDAKREQGQLQLALIGMSNIGKSHWSEQIAVKHGFERFEVDQVIQDTIGVRTIQDAAKWMGYPFEERYQTAVIEYIALEEKLTLESLETQGNLVLDSTGSFVHLSDGVLSQVSSKCLIIYLRAKPKDFDVLIERFKSTPKPLIWGDHYQKKCGQTDEQSMISSYPDLLRAREDLYAKWADVTLDVADLKTTHDTDFLEALSDAL